MSGKSHLRQTRVTKKGVLLDRLQKKYDIDNRDKLGMLLSDCALLLVWGIDSHYASKLNRVASHISKAVGFLGESAWVTMKDSPELTQGDMLSLELQKDEYMFDDVAVDALRKIEHAARAVHHRVRESTKRGRPKNELVRDVVTLLANYWRDSLKRPAFGNHINNRTITAKRDDSPDAPKYQGVDDDCRVVDFISEAMEGIASLEGEASPGGVETAIKEILPLK